MARAKRSMFQAPEPTERYDEVLLGKNVLDGIARIEEPLRSPLKGQNCLGYFYKGYLVMMKGRAPAAHKMTQVEVYASFQLEMNGGTVEVIPAKPGKHDSALHLDLSREHGAEYQGTEEVVLPGAKLRVEGKVTERKDGSLVCKMKALAVLKAQAIRAGVVGDRKKRKQKRNKKKSA